MLTISGYKKDELFSKQEYQRISIYSELCKKFHIRALFIAAVNDKYVHIMSTHIATSFFWRGFFHSLHIHENKKITPCVFSCCWPVIKMDVAKPDYLDAKFKSSIYKICLPYMFNATLIIYKCQWRHLCSFLIFMLDPQT